MIKLSENNNATKGPPPLTASYTYFFTVLQHYQALLKVLFGTNCQKFTQVKDISTTVKAIFLWNDESSLKSKGLALYGKFIATQDLSLGPLQQQ